MENLLLFSIFIAAVYTIYIHTRLRTDNNRRAKQKEKHIDFPTKK